jgi:hypothetical protein
MPFFLRSRSWLVVAVSIAGLAGAPALASAPDGGPPAWARKKPVATTTTQASTTTTQAPTATTQPPATTTEAPTTTHAAPTTTIAHIVCTASGDCGEWAVEAPTFCYWAVWGDVDGYTVVIILYPYEEDGPIPTDESAFIYCESGF